MFTGCGRDYVDLLRSPFHKSCTIDHLSNETNEPHSGNVWNHHATWMLVWQSWSMDTVWQPTELHACSVVLLVVNMNFFLFNQMAWSSVCFVWATSKARSIHRNDVMCVIRWIEDMIRFISANWQRLRYMNTDTLTNKWVQLDSWWGCWSQTWWWSLRWNRRTAQQWPQQHPRHFQDLTCSPTWTWTPAMVEEWECW